jgi:polysaccharide biosynthesis protein PslG
LGLGGSFYGMRAAVVAAALSMLLAVAVDSAGAKRHDRKPEPAPQLRGAMITPNWSIRGSAFESRPDQLQYEIHAVCRMGGDLIRVHVDWSQLQPGEYDAAYLAQLDQIMGWAAACHIDVIVDLVGSPCWAIEPAPCTGDSWIFEEPAGGHFGPVSRFLLSRYPQLHALEVWNEPNNSFWKGTPADYAALVGEAVEARNAVGSAAKILAGAFLGDGSAYLEQLYAAGMHGHDGISIHPYSLDCAATCGPFVNPVRRDSPFREAIGATHAVMLSHQDPGGIYLTEFGFATCPASPGCVPERTAARWLASSFRVAARFPYVKGLTVFSMRDFAAATDASPHWDLRSGILRVNLGPKPAFRWMKLALRDLRRARR